MLKEFNNNTSYTKLHRVVCSICGQFSVIHKTKLADMLFHMDYIINFKEKLNYKNLEYFNKFDHDFLYHEQFEKLNYLVLNSDGFYKIENKVWIYNIYIYIFMYLLMKELLS